MESPDLPSAGCDPFHLDPRVEAIDTARTNVCYVMETVRRRDKHQEMAELKAGRLDAIVEKEALAQKWRALVASIEKALRESPFDPSMATGLGGKVKQSLLDQCFIDAADSIPEYPQDADALVEIRSVLLDEIELLEGDVRSLRQFVPQYRQCMNASLQKAEQYEDAVWDDLRTLIASLEQLSHRLPECRGDVEPHIEALNEAEPVTRAILDGIDQTLSMLKFCLFAQTHPLPEVQESEGEER